MAKIDIKEIFDKRLDTNFIQLRIVNLKNNKAFTGTDDNYTDLDIINICKVLNLDEYKDHIEKVLDKHKLVDYSE